MYSISGFADGNVIVRDGTEAAAIVAVVITSVRHQLWSENSELNCRCGLWAHLKQTS